MRQAFAVIDPRSISMVTGLSKLVDPSILGRVEFELVIEIHIQGGDYVPVDHLVRSQFPVINRAFVARLILKR